MVASSRYALLFTTWLPQGYLNPVYLRQGKAQTLSPATEDHKSLSKGGDHSVLSEGDDKLESCEHLHRVLGNMHCLEMVIKMFCLQVEVTIFWLSLVFDYLIASPVASRV